LHGLRLFDPLLDISEDFVLLEVKVSAYGFFETSRRILNHVNHGELHVIVLDDVAIAVVLGLTMGCAHCLLLAWLIEEYFIAHYNSLD
jgi:hypothetical protein